MKYAAFLRAINVGRNNRIAMADLRADCEAAGLAAVRTYLQSGNIVFESDHDAASAGRLIEELLIARGLKNTPAVVRTEAELTGVLGGNPFREFPADTHSRYVTLFRSPLPRDLKPPKHDYIEIVALREREILAAMPSERPQGLDLNSWLSRQTRLEGTTRYFHVVEAVAELLAG